MEKTGQKTRDIQFFSKKNGKMLCLHSRFARDYAKYLERQAWVEGYKTGQPLEPELYAHVNSLGIRGAYFQVSWVSDFLIYFADGRKGIRELVSADDLRRKNIIEKLEFSRRYWAATDVDEWKIVLIQEEAP